MSRPRDPHDDVYYTPDTLSIKLNKPDKPLSLQVIYDRFNQYGVLNIVSLELELYVLKLHKELDIEKTREEISSMPEVEYAERCSRKRLL